MSIVLNSIFGIVLIWHGFRSYGKDLPIKKWSRKRIYYAMTYSICGCGFLAIGLSEYLPQIKHKAIIFLGCGVCLAALTPCGISIFNTQPILKFLRKAFFIVAGLALIVLSVIADTSI